MMLGLGDFTVTPISINVPNTQVSYPPIVPSGSTAGTGTPAPGMPAGTGVPAPMPATTNDILPGVDNTYLYIGAGVAALLVILLAVKK